MASFLRTRPLGSSTLLSPLQQSRRRRHQNRVTVEGDKLERFTRDDGKHYFRVAGEDDALDRGGAVTRATADLLSIQRLARYDDEMLASVSNRKLDEPPAKPGANATKPTGEPEHEHTLSASA